MVVKEIISNRLKVASLNFLLSGTEAHKTIKQPVNMISPENIIPLVITYTNPGAHKIYFTIDTICGALMIIKIKDIELRRL